jgi:hypothetical protein
MGRVFALGRVGERPKSEMADIRFFGHKNTSPTVRVVKVTQWLVVHDEVP